jgi:hypothetical protein
MIYYPQDSICIALLINTDINATLVGRIFMNTLLNALATGTEEQESMGMFSFYPNPANGSVNVDRPAGSSEPATLILSDLTGRVVYSEMLTGISTQFSTAEFPAGVYLLSLQEGSNTTTQKLVIAH